MFSFLFADALHPREGTETCAFEAYREAAEGCTSSPRGDGNCLAPTSLKNYQRCTSSPRGDGNTIGRQPCVPFPPDALHPREGTETTLRIRARCRLRCDALHPREGTETKNGVAIFSSDDDALHPREGTETRHRAGKEQYIPLMHFIPARGRKLCAAGKDPDAGWMHFIPARGRKRIGNLCRLKAFKMHFIPARGRKPPVSSST